MGQMLLLLCVLLWTLPAQAAVFWEETFENHLTPNWDVGGCGSYPQDGCNPAISTDVAFAGTHSLKGTYYNSCSQTTPGQYGCGAGYERPFPPTADVWFRFYYYTIGFTYNPVVTKHFYIVASPDSNGQFQHPVGTAHINGDRRFSMASQGEGTTPMISPCDTAHPAPQTCNYLPNRTSVSLNDNQWYCIEVHTKMNSADRVADGVMEVWVNGVQTHSYTGHQWTGYPNPYPYVSTFGSVNIYVQDGNGLMYYDNFAVGNTRIGCGPISDNTTAPAAPTGLQVR
jgi:hypothetical protein